MAMSKSTVCTGSPSEATRLDTTIERFMAPMLRLLRWSCFLNDHRARWRRTLSSLLLTFPLLIQFAYAYVVFSNAIVSYLSNPDLILSTAGGVVFISILLWITVLLSIFELIYALNWKLVRPSSSHVEADFSEEEERRIRRHLRVILAVTLTVLGTFFGMLVPQIAIVYLSAPVVSLVVLLYFVMTTLFMISMFHILFLWLCFYSQVSYLISALCRSLENSFVHMAASKELDAGFEPWRRRVEKVLGLIETLEDVFAPFLGTMIAFALVICCLCLYLFIKSSNFGALFSATTMVLFVSLTLIIFFWSCYVNHAVEHLEAALLKTDFTNVSPPTQNQVQIFLQRLSKPPAYSALRLVQVNRDSLLMMFGTCLTYAIVLIQFQPPDTPCICVFSNSTNTSALA